MGWIAAAFRGGVQPVRNAVMEGGPMEPMARVIVAHYELSGGILATSAKDLSDGDAKTRSRAGSGPSIAWTIGHLCHYKVTMLRLLGRANTNPFAASFEPHRRPSP